MFKLLLDEDEISYLTRVLLFDKINFDSMSKDDQSFLWDKRGLCLNLLRKVELVFDTSGVREELNNG